MAAAVIIDPSDPAIQRLHAEDQSGWMSQQIDRFMCGYTQNLQESRALIARVYSTPNQFQTKPGKPGMVTSTFHWIFNADGSAPCDVSQMVESASSLVTRMAHLHVNFLSKLGFINQETIRIQNELLLRWLSDLIFHPPTGFPLIGVTTAEQAAQVEANKEPSIRSLCVLILSYYLSGSKAHGNINFLSSILIRFWYRETKVLKLLFNRLEDLDAAINQSIITATALASYPHTTSP